MRYLKVTAQDRSGNGQADTVILHFYQRCSEGIDELIHETVAVDIDADRKVDFKFAGDINQDGTCDTVDSLLLKAFANTFLKLNWFNPGESWQRTLVMVGLYDYPQGPPNRVQLNFLNRRSPLRKPSLIYQAAGYDVDGNGVVEAFSRIDVDRNGVVNQSDQELVRHLCNSFLAFKWYEKPRLEE
ncbi:hypothetical protein [Pseudomonas sp. Root569]|uniref:hypothetical protein n=1 Tax=Pseudomonas sp. Root569 TaxID=1736566 RepID=UPI0007036AF3|nr:hypothetical protein [Pseudomonas sp. Root569]KRA13554.1 hypothetical protein ASD70_06380 [Pseudomonas sp. Root569]